MTTTASRPFNWSIKITDQVLAFAKDELGIDLTRFRDGDNCFAPLLAEPVKFARLVYACCEAEILANGIAPEEFGRGLARPEVLEAAFRELVAALARRFRGSPGALAAREVWGV